MMTRSGIASSPRPGPHQGLLRRKVSSIWKELRESEFERLAGTVAGSVDLKRLLDFVGLTWPAVPVQEGACASGL